MSTVAEFATQDGRPVFVELEPSPKTGLQPVSRGAAVQRVQRELLEVLKDVKPIIDATVSAIDAAATNVQKVSAKFGFKLSSSGSIVIASGTAEGHFEITLEWSPQASKS
ncbi:MAG: hypothetical protein HZA46_06145 [Planctomycetales bacterium]|nr:hypothetical protein [Planctomycetales bacterium]